MLGAPGKRAVGCVVCLPWAASPCGSGGDARTQGTLTGQLSTSALLGHMHSPAPSCAGWSLSLPDDSPSPPVYDTVEKGCAFARGPSPLRKYSDGARACWVLLYSALPERTWSQAGDLLA